MALLEGGYDLSDFIHFLIFLRSCYQRGFNFPRHLRKSMSEMLGTYFYDTHRLTQCKKFAHSGLIAWLRSADFQVFQTPWVFRKRYFIHILNLYTWQRTGSFVHKRSSLMVCWFLFRIERNLLMTIVCNSSEVVSLSPPLIHTWRTGIWVVLLTSWWSPQPSCFSLSCYWDLHIPGASGLKSFPRWTDYYLLFL